MRPLRDPAGNVFVMAIAAALPLFDRLSQCDEPDARAFAGPASGVEHPPSLGQTRWQIARLLLSESVGLRCSVFDCDIRPRAGLPP